MKSTKICFVTREYAHESMGKTGGIGVFVKQYTQQLKQHGFDILVFSFGDQPKHFDDNGVTIVKIRDLSAFNERIKSVLRRNKIPGYITTKIILEFVNRFYISLYLSLFSVGKRFDLIEFHDYGGDIPYFLGTMPKIIRCHGSAVTLHRFMGYVKRITDTIFEKHLFYRFNKHVVAVSNYSAEITQQAFKLKIKPKVIYNGVSLLSREMLNIGSDYLDGPTIPESIFYFGSIRERKGINRACEVFNKIVEQFPNATFHVLGNNNNDHWNKVAHPLLSAAAEKQTNYYGFVSNDKINEYLQKAHIVLFPSFGENFSIALMEVMSLGKLAITSTIPAFQEIIVYGKNGFMASNQKDYVTIISKIFNGETNLNEISNNAIETINERFNYDRIIKENIGYYKSLL